MYEIKARGYAMPPVDDSRETTSFDSAVDHEAEWEHEEENRII